MAFFFPAEIRNLWEESQVLCQTILQNVSEQKDPCLVSQPEVRGGPLGGL